jgi:hypothetical protein
MAKARGKAMRDIRSDLQDRADWIRQQIRAEQTQFEIVTAQLKTEQTNQLEELRAQLQAVTRLHQLATWHHDVRMATARALEQVATAEIASASFLKPETARQSAGPSG